MTTKEKLLIAYSGVLVAVLTFVGLQAIKQREALAAAREFSAAQDRIISTAQRSIEQRDKAFKSQAEQFDREKASIKTAKQATDVIVKYVPTAGAVQVEASRVPDELKQQLPDSPGYTLRTQEQEVSLGKEIVQCQKDRSALTKCLDDLSDRISQFNAAQDKSVKWKQTAEGGSAARRTVRVGILGGCGAVGAVVGKQTSNSSKGVAIGAAVGVIGCALLSK